MSQLMQNPPFSPVVPVTEILHGVPVTDPYRWLEDQDSPRTRAWIDEQTQYARSYLDSISGRDQIRHRIREFLAVETHDSFLKSGNRYVFRKRLPNQEQPCVYVREGLDGQDQLLIDPLERGTGPHTAVKPLRVSPDGRVLLYEVKQGGERTGTFEFIEMQTQQVLPDSLPRGYLRGFAFAPDGNSFYYIHQGAGSKRSLYQAAYRHLFGTSLAEDREIFAAGESDKISLSLLSSTKVLLFIVVQFLDPKLTDLYAWLLDGSEKPFTVCRECAAALAPRLINDRIFALTDRYAPNRRIVEIGLHDPQYPWIEVVPEAQNRIDSWHLSRDCIFVSYLENMRYVLRVFGLSGKPLDEISFQTGETIRILSSPTETSEVLVERESFSEPISISSYSLEGKVRTQLSAQQVPYDSRCYGHRRVSFRSKDGTSIPMYLVGRHEVLERDGNPTIMTSYGGYGVPMTPQFSIFVSFMMERGCLFALPNIRGGSEFGVEWHNAAKRRNRQTAYDDFLAAAVWLLSSGRTARGKLAIFGGSNSGLLVGAAMTQQPDLFRAVVCMVPILDMVRYHLFDNAHMWCDEFGTSEDPQDFQTLLAYSPYHQVRHGVSYPATLIVTGDADHNCNALHARKMTARLQNANSSAYPILLDYSPFRGHSPVLPLSQRVEALTDRMAFLCEQLGLPPQNGEVPTCPSYE
jgi:prolyl oligopeptidase